MLGVNEAMRNVARPPRRCADTLGPERCVRMMLKCSRAAPLATSIDRADPGLPAAAATTEGSAHPSIDFPSTANNRSPEVNTLIHLADFFNVSVDYIHGRTDNPGSSNHKYITPDDLTISDINTEQLKKYVKYMVALDDAEAADMTTEQLQYLIRISKEAIAMGKDKK